MKIQSRHSSADPVFQREESSAYDVMGIATNLLTIAGMTVATLPRCDCSVQVAKQWNGVIFPLVQFRIGNIILWFQTLPPMSGR